MPTSNNHHPALDVNATGESSLTRRDFIKLSGAAAASTALAACGIGQPTSSNNSKNKIQLVYQDWRTAWFPRLAQEMLDQFHQQHPNINVYYNIDPPSETFGEKMIEDFESGAAPDVFQGCCSYFPTWAQKGFTLDLRPYAKDLDQATLDDWDPVQYKAFFMPDGFQFGLPKYHGAMALYYNKYLFDSRGVPYPDESWSYVDYLAAMKLLSFKTDERAGGRVFGSITDISWDRIQVHVNAWGGHFVDPTDPSLCQMAESPALQAMEWLRKCIQDDRVMAGPLDVKKVNITEAFTNGWVAMAEDGSWSLKNVLTNAKFRVGLAPMPAGPVKRATLATTDGFGIYAGTKHPEAAWELLKFLISKDYGRAMARQHFLQPARASLVQEWADFIKAEYPSQAREMNISAFADGHLNRYSVVTEVFANQADAQRIASAAWEKIFVLGQAPVDIMKDVCAEIEKVQK